MKGQQIITKLEKLEQEIIKIKRAATIKFPKKVISLKGALRGIKVSEKDFQKAKKSLFKNVKL